MTPACRLFGDRASVRSVCRVPVQDRASPVLDGTLTCAVTLGAGRRVRRTAGVLVLVVAGLFASLTARLFVWPAQNSVDHVHADAVVVLNGPDPRLQVAMLLAQERAAPIILVSVSSVRWDCPYWDVPNVRLVCFTPVPATTQGEVRFAASQARDHGWRRLILVSSVPQTRVLARLRLERCFSGTVEVVTARPALSDWAYQVLYEWGALFKALILQRSC